MQSTNITTHRCDTFIQREDIAALRRNLATDSSAPAQHVSAIQDILRRIDAAFERGVSLTDKSEGVGTRLIVESSDYRSWEMEFASGESGKVHEHQCPYAFLILEGSHLKVFDSAGEYIDDLNVRPGDYRLFDVHDGSLYLPGTDTPLITSRHSVQNVGHERYRELLVEFPGLKIG